jgi:hypothetical protein
MVLPQIFGISGRTIHSPRDGRKVLCDKITGSYNTGKWSYNTLWFFVRSKIIVQQTQRSSNGRPGSYDLYNVVPQSYEHSYDIFHLEKIVRKSSKFRACTFFCRSVARYCSTLQQGQRVVRLLRFIVQRKNFAVVTCCTTIYELCERGFGLNIFYS